MIVSKNHHKDNMPIYFFAAIVAILIVIAFLW